MSKLQCTFNTTHSSEMDIESYCLQNFAGKGIKFCICLSDDQFADPRWIYSLLYTKNITIAIIMAFVHGVSSRISSAFRPSLHFVQTNKVRKFILDQHIQGYLNLLNVFYYIFFARILATLIKFSCVVFNQSIKMYA